jgi:nucleoside-diphosphate-sugar epimerase
MRYLVTGGAGFIGSHLTDRLVSDGHDVTVLDNLATGLESNLDAVRPKIKFIKGDLRNLETVREAVNAQDVIFHLGALGSVPRSIDDPITTNAVNVDGTLNILVAAKDAGVKRLIYASSSSVYGDTPVLPKVETMPMRPLSPYALSKVTAEEYFRVFHSVYGLETVSLRYFNVFGPRQRPDSQYAAVIPKFVTALLNHQAPTVHGNGTQSRDFTFVQNNVEANILAATAPAEKVAGKVFNIACDGQHSLLELIDLIQNSIGSSIKPVFVATRAGDVRDSRADIRAAQQAFGYNPHIGFKDGMAITIKAFQDQFVG